MKQDMKTQNLKYWPFNRFEIAMPEQAVEDCSHSGACDGDVEHWQQSGEIDLSHISDHDLRCELSDTGGWEMRQLQNRSTNEERIIWIAACNIREHERENG